MILGMSVEAFTTLHVIISLVAIAAGLLLLPSWLTGRRSSLLEGFFLATTVLTSVTGFFFHSKAIGPPHFVGMISLVVLAAAIYALYGAKLRSIWRPVYVIGSVAALYLNCFVAVVQAFQKIEPLRALAPAGTEPPFIAAQGVTLVLFVIVGFFAVRRYHPAAPAAA